jgi:hypothetical protein
MPLLGGQRRKAEQFETGIGKRKGKGLGLCEIPGTESAAGGVTGQPRTPFLVIPRVRAESALSSVFGDVERRRAVRLFTDRQTMAVRAVPAQWLRKIVGQQMHEATQQWNQTGKPARVFTEFQYGTKKTKKGGALSVSVVGPVVLLRF